MSADQAELTISVEGRVAGAIRGVERYFVRRRRRVLLIHGYNTSETKSILKMADFRSMLREFYPPLESDVFRMTWPGRSVLRAADYPLTIFRARQSALPLLRDIRRRYAKRGDGELILVAHSLGCRIVLETLTRLARFPRPQGLRRLTVILMAPAVPVFMAMEGGSLSEGARAADAIYVLHSKGDWVLTGPLSPFRIGETLAREGFFPEAVGSHGRPFLEDHRHDLSPAGHNNYWSNGKAAEAVCRSIGVPIVSSALDRPAAMAPTLAIAQQPLTPLLPTTGALQPYNR